MSDSCQGAVSEISQGHRGPQRAICELSDKEIRLRDLSESCHSSPRDFKQGQVPVRELSWMSTRFMELSGSSQGVVMVVNQG